MQVSERFRIEAPSDVGHLVAALKGRNGYRGLARHHGEITRSVGAWWAWHHGSREITLPKLLEVARALGGNLVVEVGKGGRDA